MSDVLDYALGVLNVKIDLLRDLLEESCSSTLTIKEILERRIRDLQENKHLLKPKEK